MRPRSQRSPKSATGERMATANPADRFPSLRKLGRSLGFDVGVLNAALNRANQVLDEADEFAAKAERDDLPL